MIKREDIFKILEAGCMAPSGGNSQPWKFKILDNSVDVYACPEKDHPVLNFQNRGTLIANGALAENIDIAANHHGFKANIQPFPYRDTPLCYFKVSFQEQDVIKDKDDLYDSIFKRSTNRKPYKKTPLTITQKKDLLMVADDCTDVSIFLEEDHEKLKILGDAASVSEIVTLENKLLHKLFFKEVVWTEKTEKERKSGLYLKTMEVDFVAERFLRLLKIWPIASLLSKFGLVRKIAKSNAETYASCSAMIVIAVDDDDKKFFNVGRVMQRLWLKAESMILYMHPITGVPYLYKHINSDNKTNLSKDHRCLIEHAYNSMTDLFGVRDGVIALLLRVGFGEAPSTHSSRKNPLMV